MQLIGAEEQRLLADLREAGYEVETVWRWMLEPPHHYLGAGEILVEHLASATDKRLIDCLAKLLSHREFAFAVPVLIAKLEEVDRLTSKHALAAALVAIGVDGHEEAMLGILGRNQTATIQPQLEKALRAAGADLSEHKRGEARRLAEYLRPRFGVTMLVCGLAAFAILAWFWGRTSPLGRSGIALYGGVEIALGALLLRRSPLAVAAYVAFVAVSIVSLVGIQRAQQLVSLPLFLLIAAVCLALVVYFGTLLFPRSS